MAIISLNDSTAWTLSSTALSATGDEITLARTEDYFNNNSFDTSLFGTDSTNNGSINENIALISSSPAATDAAIWYYKTAVDRSGTDVKIIRGQVAAIPTSQNITIFGIQQRATNPIVGASGTIDGSNTILKLLVDPGSSQIRINYYTNTGVFMYWNGTIWTNAGGSVSGSAVVNYEVRFQTNGTQWRIIILNAETGATITTTDYVNWSGTRDDGANPSWIFGGDYYNNIYGGSAIFSLFAETYTNGPTATMGSVAVGANIEAIPITEATTTNSSISWEYDIGAGWVTPSSGTLANLQTALVGTSPANLNLRATFATDGFDDATFDINGGAIAASGVSGGGVNKSRLVNGGGI